MRDAIGAARTRITLQGPVRVSDALGGAAVTWENEGDAWAAIEAVGVSHGAAFDAAPAVGGYRVTINRRDDVRAGWRVVWGARLLRVAGVRDEGGARIVMLCEEEVL